MDQSEFEDGLDRYGGDLDAWPAGLRAAADALLAGSAAARQAYRATGLVEQVIQATKPRPAESPALAARASRPRQSRPAARTFRRLGLAAGFASTLLVGILLGASLLVGGMAVPDDAPDHVLQAAFSTTETPDVD